MAGLLLRQSVHLRAQLRLVVAAQPSLHLRLYSAASKPKGAGDVAPAAVAEDATLCQQVQKSKGLSQSPLGGLAGIPDTLLATRTARITIPARTTTQNGDFGIDTWAITFDTSERWENPLMGWSSTADPLSNMDIKFDTKEAAIAYCDKHGWQYYVQEPSTKIMLKKSYGNNYSWNKRTRKNTK